jgi:malate synthase
VTEQGLRNNISVGLQYLESWLRGGGAVAINNLMEDAATAEISRSQIWQWIHNGVKLPSGEPITAALVGRLEDEELAALGADGRFAEARKLFERVALNDDFADFLTTVAYGSID